ncbi:haloacid dehalogenase-like hydrolase [Sphingomonas sp. ac-8]|uniref:haloacid dehalogenase-like hydrolase n=1 Tax=Sphingomonas sp. ac-8 TaxID=3242977 RepID=UPI003A7F74E4
MPASLGTTRIVAPPASSMSRAPADATPLFVDVDGTLIRADLSLESFVGIARSGLVSCLWLLIWLIRGRAVAKTMAARRRPVTPAKLPYREEVLALIGEARAAGRPVVLASASHRRNVQRIARHLGLGDPVMATRGRANLKGPAKLAAILRHVGTQGAFDYVGDHRADACLWRAARRGWSVRHVPRRSAVQRLGAPPPSLGRAAIKAMRPHQWAKNTLVLVPAFTSGRFVEPAAS